MLRHIGDREPLDFDGGNYREVTWDEVMQWQLM